MAEKQSIFEFGKGLLTTHDLDPVYVLVWNWQERQLVSRDKLNKWLIAYWCFYQMGTASWISEQRDFWKALATAASSREYPRGTERRHFRGKAGEKAVEALRASEKSPTELIQRLHRYPGGSVSPRLPDVMDQVKQWRGFGDWIGFKIADMLERLGLAQIDFQPDDVFLMFDAPVKGAQAMVLRHGHEGGPSGVCKNEADAPLWAYRVLKRKLGKHTAPPQHERKINIQEIETILCKWKSHLNGHYEVGKDIKECREALLKFARCRTSQQLLKAGKGTLWD